MKQIKKLFGIFAMAGIFIAAAFSTGCSDDSEEYYASGDFEYTLAEELSTRAGEGGDEEKEDGPLSFDVSFVFSYRDSIKDTIIFMGTASFHTEVDTTGGACTLIQPQLIDKSQEFDNVTLDGVCLTFVNHFRFEATAYHPDFYPKTVYRTIIK